MRDKRSVHTDALETLGTIFEHGERDAIHLAVEPVIAGQILSPGQDIGVEAGVAYARGKFLGIVDPFLKERVEKGQQFWLVVYPRTITSLRHVWSHPDFVTKEEVEIAHKVTIALTEHPSKKWLKNFADEKQVIYQELMDVAEEYAVNGQSGITLDHTDTEIPEEFWKHWETITGKKTQHTGSFFSCSC
jgi:hypothetical protein